MTSHLSIENCLSLLEVNDLSQTNNVLLTHLSDSNSHADQFKKLVENQTGKNVSVAETGLTIPFKKRPF
jgi:phosphoribosyl 1,2-cyclic phosphodiesterase